jgi:organic radical activating enzyme
MLIQPKCLAPWVHSFVHTSGERGYCCISDRFQNIDGDFWNSSNWREARLLLQNGELPKSCSPCKNSFHPMYLQFNDRYGSMAEDLMKETKEDGSLLSGPISFDHRNSFTCNFKCRMCNAEYSSSRRSEQIQLSGKESLKPWLWPENIENVNRFHKDFSEKELMAAIRAEAVSEIYWAGGEPLLNPFHWSAMGELIERGLNKQVYVRYNTNLSILNFGGKDFTKEIFQHLANVTFMVSLDATGEIGSYIRTGLIWDQFQKNFRTVIDSSTPQRVVAISHCLTTPGILDLEAMLNFAHHHDVEIQSQLVDFGYESNFENPLNPLFFPKEIRAPWIQRNLDLLNHKRSKKNETVFQLLESLRNQEDLPLTEERKKNIRGSFKKKRQIEEFRGGKALEDFLHKEKELLGWLEFNRNF